MLSNKQKQFDRFTSIFETLLKIRSIFPIDFPLDSEKIFKRSFEKNVSDKKTRSISIKIITFCSNNVRPSRRNCTPAARFHVETHSLDDEIEMVKNKEKLMNSVSFFF